MTKTRKITQTGLLLALCVLFQNLRIFAIFAEGPLSQFVIGSLVNLVIIVAVGTVGLSGSLAISILAPILAFVQGHLRFSFFIPLVAVGNAIPPLIWYLFSVRKKHLSQLISVILSSITKFLFLRLTIPFAYALFMSSPAPPPIILTFSFPQIITTLIGGTFGIIILRVLPRNK